MFFTRDYRKTALIALMAELLNDAGDDDVVVGVRVISARRSAGWGVGSTRPVVRDVAWRVGEVWKRR